MDTFRHWLSATLLGWSIQVLPEGVTKYWMQYAVSIAIKGLEESLNESD